MTGAPRLFKRSGKPRSPGTPYSQATLTSVAGVFWIVVTAVAGLLLGKLSQALEGAALVLVCVAASSLLAAFVAYSLARGRLREWVAPRVDQEHLATLAKERLLPDDHLCAFEEAVEVPDIWVVTEVPGYDSSGKFRKVIEANIADRHIRYSYVVPDTVGQSVINAVIRDLPAQNLNVVQVPAEAWSSRPITAGTIIIYNPNSASKFAECVAYFEYPETDPPLWGRVETSTATVWADQVRRIAPGLAASA